MDTEILFLFTLSNGALAIFRFSQHPLPHLEGTLTLNADTLTASGVSDVVSSQETKCSIVVMVLESGYILF